ncbi:hypothetical protein SAMN05421770_101909 [Granulicella rosea]|uniref:Catalase n=1 Tax=Granulicella rosea TaxID=474952 RepID=A0A239ECJ9_9BACT|nr:hypothetical protein [Granulicella rosea]SNS42405.1 hypothetical protein SAMN05421770_101909 [Granulicella rosea]
MIVVPVLSLRVLTGKEIDLGAGYNAIQLLIQEFFADETAVWDLKVQLALASEDNHQEESAFPNEKADKPWPEEQSPWPTVATITVRPQNSYSDARQTFVDEQMSFTPWHKLAIHRPLGGIMRAGRKAYEDAAKYRSQRNARTIVESVSADTIPA